MKNNGKKKKNLNEISIGQQLHKKRKGCSRWPVARWGGDQKNV